MPRGPNPKHTACRPGTRVVIKTISGEVIDDIFVERKGNGVIILERYGRITKDKMRSFRVYKPPHGKQ